MVNGFNKWLASSKLQVAVLCIVLIYLQQLLYGLSAEIVAGSLVKICIAYLGARILEPIVEMSVSRFKKGDPRK